MAASGRPRGSTPQRDVLRTSRSTFGKTGKASRDNSPAECRQLLAKSGNPGRARSASLRFATDRKPRNPFTSEVASSELSSFPRGRVRIEPGTSFHSCLAPAFHRARRLRQDRLARFCRRLAAPSSSAWTGCDCRGAKARGCAGAGRRRNAACGDGSDTLPHQGL
jgi:hypothetical protein